MSDVQLITKREWADWRWHIQNKITTIKKLKEYIELDNQRFQEIDETSKQFPFAITPYYANLMDKEDKNCPIQKQVIPSIEELHDSIGIVDPLSEEQNSPVPSIIRRYPDRLVFYVTNQCFCKCRFCSRKRRTAKSNRHMSREELLQGIEYIKNHKEIRDVLISGGDPLTLSDEQLEGIISRIREINHVEIIRIGTRAPVTLPQRITPKLCKMLEKYHPIWVNTHFNHPKEVTKESTVACDLLSKAGIPLGNQTVLLKGINDSPNVMKKLAHELLKIRVRPYYIFHCYPVKGVSHFRTSVDTGIKIIEKLRGHTSGLAVPTYVVNAPCGGGKVPLGPNYIISRDEGKLYLRNYKMEVFEYPNPPSYEKRSEF